MADKQLSINSRKRIKQIVSVPFVWEERPGVPKWRNWKQPSIASPVNQTNLSPPIKLNASVPFHWEQEPGKPLASYTPPYSPEPTLLMLEWVEKPQTPEEPPLLMLEWAKEDEKEEEEEVENPRKFNPFWESSSSDSSSDGEDEGEESSENTHEGEAWDAETVYDSFSSAAPSLLANCLVPTTALSTAIPAQKTFSGYIQAPSSPAWEIKSGYIQAPSSPAWETESSASSYATGTTSLVGAPFLECLFPLLTPNSSFLKKVNGCSEKGRFSQPSRQVRDLYLESNCNDDAGRKALTLGELIMMSRRRSIQRKAVQIKEQNLSMEFMRKTASGCCIAVGGLQDKWKTKLQLTLI